HIIADEWSLKVFFRELGSLYTSFIENQPAALPELPIQYSDFAVWQLDWLQGNVLEEQLQYWTEQLKDAPPATELRTDQPRGALATFNGGNASRYLPKPLAEALRLLGRQEEATLFMVLLAAFKALLYRYSGQEDLMVGSPIAGRTRIETEALIGFFVNTLVLRTKLCGDKSFRELLKQVRTGTLG